MNKINYIFIDETDSKSEQLKKIMDEMKFGHTNMIVDKSWRSYN